MSDMGPVRLTVMPKSPTVKKCGSQLNIKCEVMITN